MKRSLAILIAAMFLGGVVATALARPVRIGYFTQIARGAPTEHPCGSARCDSRRSGRANARAADMRRVAWRTELPRGAPGVLATSACMISLSHGVMVAPQGMGLAYVGPTGQILANAQIGAVRHTPLVTPDNEVMAVTQAGEAVLLDLDGQVTLRRRLEAVVMTPPVLLPDGTLVFGSSGNMMHGVSSADFVEIFSTQLMPGALVVSPVTLDEDTFAVLVGRVVGSFDAAGRARTMFVSDIELRGLFSVGGNGTAYGPSRTGTMVQVRVDEERVTAAPITTVSAEAPLIAADGSLRVYSVHDLVGTDSVGNATFTYTNATRRIVSGTLGSDGTTVLVLEDPTRATVVLAVDNAGVEKWSVSLPERPRECAPMIRDDGHVVVLATDTAGLGQFVIGLE